MIEPKNLSEAEVDMTYFRILSFIQCDDNFIGTNYSNIEEIHKVPYIKKMYEEIKIHVSKVELDNYVNYCYNMGFNGGSISLKDATNILSRFSYMDNETYYKAQKYITRISRIAYVSGYCNNH